MINLLPSEVKKQVTYSKWNAVLLRYVILAIIISLISGAGVAYGAIELNKKVSHADRQIADNKRRVEEDKDVQARAKAINERISSIQKIQTSQAKFSLLLQDIASYIPRGTAIESISLDGDDKKPVRISGSAQTYESAAVVASSLARSDRVSEARTEGIEFVEAKKNYRFTVSVSFKPGKSR